MYPGLAYITLDSIIFISDTDIAWQEDYITTTSIS